VAIEGDVQTVLAALVAGRCYPLVAPDSPVKPYIIYQVISNPTLNSLEGDMGLSRRRFQVDVWADTYGAAKGLAKAATLAMAAAAFSNIKLGDHDAYDPETKARGVSLDFSIWGES
jgi:hypothetical protein